MQWAGRVIRNRNDYDVVVLADKRLSRAEKRTKPPQWIANLMPDSECDVHAIAAAGMLPAYIMEMEQLPSYDTGGKVLLDD